MVNTIGPLLIVFAASFALGCQPKDAPVSTPLSQDQLLPGIKPLQGRIEAKADRKMFKGLPFLLKMTISNPKGSNAEVLYRSVRDNLFWQRLVVSLKLADVTKNVLYSTKVPGLGLFQDRGDGFVELFIPTQRLQESESARYVFDIGHLFAKVPPATYSISIMAWGGPNFLPVAAKFDHTVQVSNLPNEILLPLQRVAGVPITEGESGIDWKRIILLKDLEKKLPQKLLELENESVRFYLFLNKVIFNQVGKTQLEDVRMGPFAPEVACIEYELASSGDSAATHLDTANMRKNISTEFMEVSWRLKYIEAGIGMVSTLRMWAADNVKRKHNN